MSLEDDVKKIVSEKLSVAIDEVKSDSNFIDDLRADSLDIVDLTIAIEEEFAEDAQFEIRDEDAENIRSVQDILDFLKAQGLE